MNLFRTIYKSMPFSEEQRRIHKLMHYAGIICLITFFFACAHGVGVSNTQETLKEKVNQLWNARVNKEWGKIYDMMAVPFQQSVSREDFIKKSNVSVLDFTVKDIQITEPGKKALVFVDYRINQMGYDFVFPSKDEWIWENNDWRVNKPPGTKTPMQ